MSEKGLTTIALKKINRSKIYQYIYRSKLTSKLQIVQDLQMGLSTVSQNLNLLENEGLIEKNGYFDSTGGRKANAIQIVSDFRISIGVGILKNMFHITAIDLYGNTVYTDTIPLTYSNTAAYYQQITDKVKDFIDKNQYPENKILGVSIATQGITSPDNTTVIYGNIMNNTGMRLKDFSRHLPYPCHLEHDSKSAAFLELWNHPELDSAVVLLLNRNLGGAIITNHQIHQGRSMHSGTIEHICVNPDGPLCYCGNRGCLETYCSANSLEQASGMTIKEFFSFRQNKYFWINILAMIAVVVLLMFGTLKGIDIYTHHGEAVVVPDVKGMTVAEAGAVFDSRGLACIVSDSTYVKDKPAGCILDYNPAAGQKVKEGRIIYLTINAINIPLQVVPDVADNSSLRQAEARILASGFKLNDIQYVPGEKDWVYGVKYRERMLAIGDKVPMGATLTLMVGDGNREVLEGDSLSADESMGNPDEAVSEGSAADESWF